MKYKLAKLGKYCLLGLLISLSLHTFSQGVPSKVKKLYDKGEYEKCIEVTKTIKSRGDNVKNPYLYIYQVMAYHKIAESPEDYNTRQPVEKALRAYAAFKRKDKDGAVTKEFKEYINEFRDFAISYAQTLLNDTETLDNGFKLMITVSELFEEDYEMQYARAKMMMDKGSLRTKTDGMNEMIRLANSLYTKYKAGQSAEEGMDKVFAELATFMFTGSNRTMATEFLDKGKEMYPDSELLMRASLHIIDQKINLNSEVSSLELIMKSKKSVEQSLLEYPNNKELLEKEDVIISILIDKYFHQGSSIAMAEAMMNHINKYAGRRTELIDKYNTYLMGIITNKNWLEEYNYKRVIGLETLAIFSNRLEGKAEITEKDKLSFVKGLLNEQFSKNNLDSLFFYYELADKWRPDNAVLSSYMKSLNYKGIADKISNQPPSLTNFAQLMMVADNTKGNKFYAFSEADYAYSYGKQLLAAKNYRNAAYVITVERKRNPGDKRFLALKKELVVEDYIINYLGSIIDKGEFKWNGSLERCNPGTVPPEIQAKIIQRIAYVRRLAGIRDDVFLDEEYNQRCQAAALMMDANNKLNHSPSKSWKCYTEEGYKGASTSNLSLGHSLVNAVMGQMEDNGASNTACGHRRWILKPTNLSFGHGSTPSAMALGVFNGVRTNGSIYDSLPPVWTEHDFVAWPSADYFIEDLVPRRWSFSYSGADFNNAKVSVKVNGKNHAVSIEPLSQGYGLNTVVWYIDGFKYDAGQKIEITVSNFTAYRYTKKDNKPLSVSYTVELLPAPKGS